MSFIITLTGILFVTQLVSHFFNRWGIPDVIGQILVGIVAGPAVLGWIHQTAMIEEFQEIGVIVLMFIAGLESDLSLLKKYLKPAMAVAVGGMALPIVVMGLASQLFGLQWFESLFIGVIFSATSVSISVAVLREFNQIDSKEGATVLGAAVADDIGGVLILSVLISLMNGKGGESSTSLPLIIMMQAIFFGGTYLLVRWLAPYLMHLSKHLLTTAAPAVMAMILCLGMASLADLVHLSGAVGAFFAGIAVGKQQIGENAGGGAAGESRGDDGKCLHGRAQRSFLVFACPSAGSRLGRRCDRPCIVCFAGSVRLGSAVCFGIVGRPKLLDAQFNRIVNKGLDDLRQFAVAAFGDFGAEHGAQGEVLQFGHGTSAGLQIGDGLPCDS